MKLKLRQMEVIRAVVNSGSITNAARELCVTQPAISRLLSQTEQQLGLALFHRHRGRLQATPEAHALLVEIDRARESAERVNELARALAEQRAGSLRVACSPSLAQALVPRALAMMGTRHPGVAVKLRSSLVATLVSEVLNDDVEVGVSALPADHPNLNTAPLCTGNMVAIVPRHSPLAARPKLGLEDLGGQPMIVIGRQMHFGRIVIEAFRRSSVPLREWADVPYSQLACSLVNSGAGVSIVDPFSVLDSRWPNLVVRPLRQRIAINVTLLTARTRPMSLVGAAFCRLLEQVCSASRKDLRQVPVVA